MGAASGMNVWKILGIDQTTDSNQIKQAYAARAKECHPEEHPEEYQILRQAYKEALRYAKWQKEQEAEGLAAGPQTMTGEHPVEPPHSPAFGIKPETEEELKEAGGSPLSTKAERDAGWDGDLNFGEVETNRKKELKDRFFREFCDIARNPYLMNNSACWRFFLNQNEYLELFAEPDIWDAFAYEMRRFSKWDKSTILFLEQRLRHLGGTGEGRSLWKRVRWHYYFERICFAGENEGIVEKEMLRLHGRILEQVRNSGIWVSASLQSPDAVDCYLQFYFAYAAENRERLEKSCRKNHRIRRMIRLSEVLAVFLFLSFWVAELILPGAGVQDQSGGESRNMQAEEAMELQEEDRQKIEEILEDTTERYQSWLEKNQ